MPAAARISSVSGFRMDTLSSGGSGHLPLPSSPWTPVPLQGLHLCSVPWLLPREAAALPGPQLPKPALSGPALTVLALCDCSYQLGSGEARLVSEDPIDDGEWHRVTALR